MRLLTVRNEIQSLSSGQQKELNIYSKRLSTDRLSVLIDPRMQKTLYEVGSDPLLIDEVLKDVKLKKWGQSVYQYAQIEEQIQRFEGDSVADFSWNKHFQESVAELCLEFSKYRSNSIRYRSEKDIIDNIARLDSHAGYTGVITGKSTKGENLDDIYVRYIQAEAAAIENGSFNRPIVCGARTQASSLYDKDGNLSDEQVKYKTRLVSMIDIIQIIAETKFAKPIQKELSNVDWYAGGKNDPEINAKMQRWYTDKRYWICLDYSKFDQSISSWLIRAAFKVVRSAFENDRNFDSKVFDVVVEDFINKVFIDGKGRLRYSQKGVPSGSMFTQIIDSIVNKLMINTYLKAKQIKDAVFMIMGDDNIIFSEERLDLEDISGYLGRNFGIEMNPSKCDVKEHERDFPRFLSREWRPRGVYRNIKVLISKLLCPEMFRNYGKHESFTPKVIIDAYRWTYPLSIIAFLKDTSEVRIPTKDRMIDKRVARYFTGLMRYRALYLNAS